MKAIIVLIADDEFIHVIKWLIYAVLVLINYMVQWEYRNVFAV
jgi:hypothetical protein